MNISRIKSLSNPAIKERCEQSRKDGRESLQNHYVKGILLRLGFDKEVISPELLQTKRTLLQLKRLVREKMNGAARRRTDSDQ